MDDPKATWSLWAFFSFLQNDLVAQNYHSDPFMLYISIHFCEKINVLLTLHRVGAQ